MMRRVRIMLVLAVILGLAVAAQPAAVDAQEGTPPIEILSPADGAIDVETPLVVTGQVDTTIEWRDVWIKLDRAVTVTGPSTSTRMAPSNSSSTCGSSAAGTLPG